MVVPHLLTPRCASSHSPSTWCPTVFHPPLPAILIMEEEVHVLLTAAELGRSDIIGKAIESLTAGSPADVSPREAHKERQRLISVIRESDGASALHISSANGHVDATRALLRLGASPEVKGLGALSGKTPWDVATTAVRQVFANELFSQVAYGDDDKVLALLQAGVQADVTDGGPRSDTPLHWAAGAGHASICSALLDNGSDVEGCNSEGASALHEASRGGHASVVSLLLERGANPHVVGTGGEFKDKTPLQVSSSEAVTEALHAVPPPARAAAPFSARQLLEKPDGRRVPSISSGGAVPGSGTGSGDEDLLVRLLSDRHNRHPAKQVKAEDAGDCTWDSDEQATLASLKTAAGARGDIVNGGGSDGGCALPMLWPPPKSCTVLGDEVCRIPARVVLVLPAEGAAAPGTLIFQTLQAALSHCGISMICTRGRCPPGSGGEFFITLACGGLQGACSTSSSARGGQGFSVVVGSGMVRVAGTGEPGLFYGVRTLCQLLQFYAMPLPSNESALDIPCCILKDEPDVVRRSLVVDARYPLLPTLPSLMRTIEAASRSRINVIQLTVTRETASWLVRHDQDGGRTKAIPATRGGGAFQKLGQRGLPDTDLGENGAWGWGALGKIGAFCMEHFVELVLGWAVVPGDEPREAQRAAVQLLSSLSRQFQSDEMHIVFEEGVHLAAFDVTPEAILDRPEERRRPEENPVIGVNTGTEKSRERLSSSEPGDAPHAVPTSTDGGEGFSLTRFLSNVVVACSQRTIVLDGIPPAVLASLQGVGYLPVELAFSMGTDTLNELSFGALSEDVVINGRSDDLAVFLGPAHLGYICAGHQGPGSGRREEACFSIHGALADVAKAVAKARRTGCGMQLRVSTATAAGMKNTSPRNSRPAAFSDATCEGGNLYYPTLLSNALEFLAAGLCWRLDKASTALHLSTPGGGAGEGRAVVVRGDSGLSTGGERAGERKPSEMGPKPLRGPSDPATLLLSHMLRANDAGTQEAVSSSQLISCLRMLLESWDPFPCDEGSCGARDRENVVMRNLDSVLWAVHAPGGNGSLHFSADDDSRFVLSALQSRYLRLEEALKIMPGTLEAATAILAPFMELRRAVRVLKVSGRLLLAAYNHVCRLDQRVSKERSNNLYLVRSPSTAPTSTGPGLGDGQQDRYDRPASNQLPTYGNSARPAGADIVPQSAGKGPQNRGSREGVRRNRRNLQKTMAQLPSSTRLDFANRYLEEFRALSASWDSTTYLSMGKMVLHSSLSGLLRNLAHDESAAQMKGLCESTIFNR